MRMHLNALASQCCMPWGRTCTRQKCAATRSPEQSKCQGRVYHVQRRFRRAVRTEASVVLGALAACVGRGLAAALRPLAGPWWLAQFDPASEAARAARAAFQAAFPGSRQREALLFCRAQVLNCVQTVLPVYLPIECVMSCPKWPPHVKASLGDGGSSFCSCACLQRVSKGQIPGFACTCKSFITRRWNRRLFA